MIKHIIIYLFSVFISSCSQILLKLSAEEEYDNIIKEYINWKVIIAYSILLCSSFLTIYAYKMVPLSLGVVLEASAYLYVAVLGFFVLHEKIGKKGATGMLLVLIGIVISSI